MLYDLFYQLLYIRSACNNEVDFLKETQNMTPEEIRIRYEILSQTAKETVPVDSPL